MICTLTPQQQEKVLALVIKNLQTAVDTQADFNVKDYLQKFYDKRKAALADVYPAAEDQEAKALDFTRVAAYYIDKVVSSNDVIGDYMVDKIDHNELKRELRKFKDDAQGLENVRSFLGISLDPMAELAEANQVSQQEQPVEQEPIAEPVSNANAPVTPPPSANATYSTTSEQFEAVKPTAYADQDQEAIEWKDKTSPDYNKPNPALSFYYKVKRAILAKLYSPVVNQDSRKLNLMEWIDGTYLTVMPISKLNRDKLRSSDLQPRTDRSISNYERNEPVLVITSENGHVMHFNEEGEYASDGKPAYYYLRDVYPSQVSNGKVRLWKSSTPGTVDDFTRAEAMVRQSNKTSQPLTLEQAQDKIQKQLQFIYDLRKKMKDNPELTIRSTITGGSFGFANMDYNINTNLSDVSKDQVLDFKVATADNPVTGEKKNRTYVTTSDTGLLKIEVYKPSFKNKPEIMNKVLDLMFKDIVDENDNKLNNKDRLDYLSQYLLVNSDKVGFFIEPDGSYKVKVYGETVYQTFPTQKVNARTGVVEPITTKPTAAEIAAKEQQAIAGRQAVKDYLESPVLAQEGKPTLSPKTAALPNVKIVKGDSFTDPDVQQQIKAALDEGKIVYFANLTEKLYYTTFYPQLNIKKDINDNANYTEVSVEDKDGKSVLKKVSLPYSTYLRDNFYMHYPLNGEGKILKLNAYFTYEPIEEDVEKIYPKEEVVQATPVTQAPITSSNANNEPTTGLDAAFDDPSLQKNLDQKNADKKATQEQIKAAKEWYENHPMSKHFPFEVLFNAINSANPRAAATWTLHAITLFKGSDYSDLYHEAWHGFTQAFLTKEQKKALYAEVGRKTGSFTDYEGNLVTFKKANEKQLEEYLAEDFRSWMLSGAKYSAKPTVKQSLFQKILDFLKALLNDVSPEAYNADTQANSTIHALYEKMRVGNLNEYTFSQDNVSFTVLNKGAVAIEPTAAQKFMSYEHSKFITDTMDSFMVKFVDDFGNGKRKSMPDQGKSYKWTSTLLTKPAGIKYAYQQILKDMVDVHNGLAAELETIQQAGNVSSTQFDANLMKANALQKKIDLFGWAIANFGDVDKLINNRPQKGEGATGMIAYHMLKSKVLPKATKEAFYDEEVLDEAELFVRGREGFDRKGNESSLVELASEEILFVLKGLHKVDVNGNPIYVPGTESVVNGKKIGVPQIEDFDKVWNVMAKLLQNTLSVESMYAKMQKHAKDHPDFPMNQLLNSKLGPLVTDGVNEFNMWTNFYQTFNKTRVPLLQTTVEIETKDFAGTELTLENWAFNVRPGKASSDISKIASRWQQSFAAEQPSKYIKTDAGGINYLDLGAIMREFPTLASVTSKGEMAFLDAIGFKLDKGNEDIEQGLKDNTRAVQAFWRAISNLNQRRDNAGKPSVKIIKLDQLKKDYPEVPKRDGAGNIVKVRQGGRMVDDVIYKLGGEGKNWNAILELQAQYSDKEGNFSVSNAEGNMQFEHTLNNSLTVMVNAINDSATYQELISLPWMGHMKTSRNPAAKASLWLNSIYDMKEVLDNGQPNPKFGQKRIVNDRGDVAKLNLQNLSGVAIKKDGDFDNDLGIASASADAVTKLLMDFHMVMLKGAPELMRHADKGTSFSVFLNAVYNFDGKKTSMYVNTLDYLRGVEGTNYTVGDQRLFKSSVLPHMNAELTRIHMMRKMAQEGTTDFDFDYLKRGQGFVVFGDILTVATKKKVLAQVKGDLLEYLKTNTPEARELEAALLKDVTDYFNKESVRVEKMFSKAVTPDGQPLIAQDLYKNLIGEANNSENGDIKGLLGSATAPNKKIIKNIAIKSFVANSWVHNIESIGLIYGDLAQYNIEKEEFHKRNAGASSTGTIYRTDKEALRYVNEKLGRGYLKKEGIADEYGPYNGIMNTAVVEDNEIRSAYFKEYADRLIAAEIAKGLSEAKAKEKVFGKGGTMDKPVKGGLMYSYHKMTEGDGQGWITFDSYRIMLNTEGKWSEEQEFYYQKIINKEHVDPVTVATFFPTQKVQYYGPLDSEGLPITAFHKFSLFPLIPSAIQDTRLKDLHNKMVAEGVDYALFKSGSKVGTITKDGKTDKLYSSMETRAISPDKFTKNKIFMNYLKNQLEIAPKFKSKVVFSTQLRKLIEDGLMEGGVPTDFMMHEKSVSKRRKAWAKIVDKEGTSAKYKLVKAYERNVAKLTEIKKQELLDEMGWSIIDGKAVGGLESLLKFVKKELSRQDMGDHEIDFIDLAAGGKKLKHDLSMSLSAEKIEKMLNAIVTRRLINQKVNGEMLIQVSGAGFESSSAYETARNLKNPTQADLEKWGTNDLPTYSVGKDGKTTAMKVKIAMQGRFKKLLNLKDKEGNTIYDVNTLNKLLKDEEWLNIGDHRRMVTMVGVRIPVQGLNSMEFMEVYEFLPAIAGNIIVPPAEIVAKAGADFDIDKLTIMMPNISNYIDADGRKSAKLSKQVTREEALAQYEDYKKYRIAAERKKIEGDSITKTPEDLAAYNDLLYSIFGYTGEELDQEMHDMLMEEGKLKDFDTFFKKLNGSKEVENDILWNLREILELPDNFVSLITPNGTEIVKPLADDLEGDVNEYSPKERLSGALSAADAEELRESPGSVSGSRMLEIGYNMYKHQSNKVGKETLGLGAVDNTFNSVFNRIGAYLNPIARVKVNKGRNTISVRQTLLVDHNTLETPTGKAISLSHTMDAEGNNRISDVISQLLNGWVDVAKDAWIFNIQGNKEVAPVLMFMIQAGVPFKTAVYLASQPMVRDYVEAQRSAKSSFGDILGTSAEHINFYRTKAKKSILNNAKYGFGLDYEKIDRGSLKYQFENTERITNEVLAADGNKFSEKKLHDEITGYKKSLKAGNQPVYSDYQRAAFLHYLEIEEMGKVVRDIKMRMNVDTKKSTNLFEAQNKTILIEELREHGRIPEEIVDKILSDSPIGSFHIQPFQIEVWKDLFPLRNSKVLNDFLAAKMKDGIMDDVSSTFGDDEKFTSEFRNSIVSSIFQNTLKSFDVDTITHYKGEEVLGTASTLNDKERVKSLALGVFFKDNKVFVDKQSLKRQFLNKLYEKNAYKSAGLAVLKPGVINDEQEYNHFVFEREFLRSIYKNVSSIERNPEFISVIKNIKTDTKRNADETDEAFDNRTRAIAFEEFIKQKALENIFNATQLFKGDNTYADKLVMIKELYPQLMDDYSVLKVLVASSSGKNADALTNIQIQDNLKDPEMINLYHENMMMLSDPTVKKVEDATANKMISEYFSKLPIVAFLQSGMSIKSRFSITRIMPQDAFIRMMEKPMKEYTAKLNPLALELFYNRFVQQNNYSRVRTRQRYSDYTIPGFNLNTSYNGWRQGATDYLPNPYSQEARDLLETDFRGIATYDTRNINVETAKELANNNPDKIFVFNDAFGPNPSTTTAGLKEDKIFRGLPIVNKIGLPIYNSSTYSLTVATAIKDVNDEISPELKTKIDNMIDVMRDAVAAGKTLVFSNKGYGQEWNGIYPEGTKEVVSQVVAPKSFLYLSEQLYRNFGYVNAGYEVKAEGRKVLQESQPITDDEVRDFMSKCFK